MAEVSWWQVIGAALGGGFTVKVLDIAYQEIRKRLDKTDTAEKFVDQHLDPLLKATDELVGKLRSLADEDFKTIKDVDPEDPGIASHDFGSLLFLFAKFYAQVEIIRREGMSVAMSKDDRGKKLQQIFDCLEGRRVRILPRINQRAIGEATLTDKGPMTYIQFVAAFEANEPIKRWSQPLANYLSRMEHTTVRQLMLQYATVLHVMVDTLDPNRAVTRERPSVKHKLSRKTWRDLNYRVFKVYLTFVKDRQKYIGPPKKAAPKAVVSKGKGGTVGL